MTSLRTTMTVAALAAITFTASVASAAPVKYSVDPVHSFIIFKIRHFNVGNAYAEFNDFKGSLNYDKDAPENSSIELTVDVNSLDTKNPKRDEHVKSPDFLNAAQFPTMAFKSDSVKKADETHFDVTGQLTLHGVTKPVSFKLEKIGEGKDPKGGERIGGEATFTIKRSDYGIAGMPQALGDDVTITVALEGVKEAAAAPAQ